ncbi:MAG: SDR family NAD(P)-dependent oxidoreductase, partial [Bacteroidota bacterium]
MSKTIFITGASAGIGAATARAFAFAGDRVILSARSADRLRQLADEIDGETHVLPLDVTDAQAHLDAIAHLPDPWRAIDVAVLNAGLALNLVPVWENTP